MLILDCRCFLRVLWLQRSLGEVGGGHRRMGGRSQTAHVAEQNARCFFRHILAYTVEPLRFVLSACENAHALASAAFFFRGHSTATLVVVDNRYKVCRWNKVQYCLAGGAMLFQQICL